jgi:hypothetical protein
MTQRGWLWTLGLGRCSLWLPACQHTGATGGSNLTGDPAGAQQAHRPRPPRSLDNSEAMATAQAAVQPTTPRLLDSSEAMATGRAAQKSASRLLDTSEAMSAGRAVAQQQNSVYFDPMNSGVDSPYGTVPTPAARSVAPAPAGETVGQSSTASKPAVPATLATQTRESNAAPRPTPLPASSGTASGLAGTRDSFSAPPAPAAPLAPSAPPGKLAVDLEKPPETLPDRLAPPAAPHRVKVKLTTAEAQELPGQPTRGPAPEEPLLLRALRCYLNQKPEDAVAMLAPCDHGNQELLLCLMPLLVQLAEGGKPSPQQTAVTLEELNSLMAPLRTRAPLVIDRMCFCQHIDSFGVYKPLPEGHECRSGEMVHVYVEVRDDHGNKVWGEKKLLRDGPDQSQTLRQDYFDHYRICLPELKPGYYTLVIRVKDLATNRVARRSLDFRMDMLPGYGS